MFRLFRRDRDRGAAMVEFAIILPLFILLIFGTMETGWFFAQVVEGRNAAREGARLAVVDFGTASQIATETCDRAGLSSNAASVQVTRSGTLDDDLVNTAGVKSPESIAVTMTFTYTSLTGVFDFFDGNISSSAEMRTERPLELLLADGGGTC